MPVVQERPKKVVLAFSADWHLSLHPPLARSTEKDWLGVQYRYFCQIKKIVGDTPLVVAGDVFDKPNPPIELVNFCIDEMPKIYAIPGNHELPYHSYDYLECSAFATLAKAGVITMFERLELSNQVILHGFPFGTSLEPLKKPSSFHIDVAVVHEFVWTNSTGFPGAKDTSHLSKFREKADGYDLVIIGDNHKPFRATKQTPMIVNCGSLFRRSIDQIDHTPMIWLLYSDNSVESVLLDTSGDVFFTPTKLFESLPGLDMSELVTTLQDTKEEFVSFTDVLLRLLDSVENPEVREVVLRNLALTE